MAETSDRLLRLVLCRYAAMGVGAQEALLLLHLVEMGGLTVQASRSALARRMGISPRRVREVVSSLVDKGLLTVSPTIEEGKRQEANVYDIGSFVVACGER